MDELEHIIQTYNIDEAAAEAFRKHNKKVTRKDTFTGLLNQNGLQEQIQDEIKRTAREQREAQEQGRIIPRYEAGLIILDLDKQKEINDTYGHDTGNEQIQGTARILRATYKRPTDFIARWGGDEFGIFNGNQSKEQIIMRALELAETLNNSTLPNTKIPFRSSIGIAFFPTDGNNYEILFRKADQAMYGAKKDTTDPKNNRVRVYGAAHNFTRQKPL